MLPCRPNSPDLDWITMKAIAKDRDRRYGSAADLAEDVERHPAQLVAEGIE